MTFRGALSYFALIILPFLVLACKPESVAPAPERPLPQNVLRLIERIDEDPDINHADFTPAVLELSRLGEQVFPAMLNIIEEDSEYNGTRLHAQRVIYLATKARFGFKFGSGWAQETDRKDFEKFWTDMGGLDSDAELGDRRISVEKWRKWLGRINRGDSVRGVN